MRSPTENSKAAAALDAGKADRKSRLFGWMPPLDGLRGLAILMVLTFHFGTSLSDRSFVQHTLKTVTKVGWSGVDLFFVLSGFLITGILLDSKHADNYFASFYFRRALRIFPVYYLSLLLLFLVFPILVPGFERMVAPPSERIWYFAYIQNWLNDSSRQEITSPYFSLGIEEQFYLVWPWIIYSCTTKRILRIALGGSGVALLLRWALVSMKVDPQHIYRNTFTRMDALLIGAACMCLLRDPSCVKYLRRFAPWMWIAPAITLVVLGAAQVLDEGYLREGGGWFTAVALSYGALLVGVVLTMGSDSLLQRTFTSGVMTRFGKYSYGIYVWHLIAQKTVLKLESSLLHAPFPALINLPLTILAALIFGMVSYALVERPFLSLKHHFEPRFPAPRTMVAPES